MKMKAIKLQAAMEIILCGKQAVRQAPCVNTDYDRAGIIVKWPRLLCLFVIGR